MCALWLSSTCRVCLASGREMYRLANTPFEETYERVTRGTLVLEGRPCCVCGVCLSTLRRCRRFMDSAREANDALERWSQDQAKPTECPLFSFSHSPVTIFEITSQESEVKPDIVTTENYNRTDILVKKIKLEITSDEDCKNTQMSDAVECQNTGMSHSESINLYDKMVDIKVEMEQDDDVEDHSKMSVDFWGNQATDEDGHLTRLRSTTMSEDTEKDPLLKSLRSATPEHPENTELAASSHHHTGNTFSCTHCQTINRQHLKKGKEKKLSGMMILKTNLQTHWPVRIPPAAGEAAKNRQGRLRCVVCTKNGRCRKTPYKCESCDVPLCVEICFKNHHTA